MSANEPHVNQIMHRFSLYYDAKDLKIQLQISTFLGEASWTKSANICKGDIIPVLMKNHNGKKYLHSMKWGTNIFGHNNKNMKQLQNQARDDKLLSTNINNPWLNLISNHQRCIIIAKGFYFNNYTEVMDTKYKKKYNDKQPYFVTPYIPSEGKFFYIAALYRIQQSPQVNRYGAISITKSTKDDNQLRGYIERMPYLLRPKDIDKWLDGNISIQTIFSLKYKIRYNEFEPIGLWINDVSIKNEKKILRSRSEWDFEKNARMTGMEEEEFPWDEIEQEALTENDAKKHGIEFKPKLSWDELRTKKLQTMKDSHDDTELKQEEEEYTQTDYGTNHNNRNGTKRKRDSNHNNKNKDKPANKKQKTNHNINNLCTLQTKSS